MYDIKDLNASKDENGIYTLKGSIGHPQDVVMAISSMELDEANKAILFAYGAQIGEGHNTCPIELPFHKPEWVEKAVVQAKDEKGRVEDEDAYILQ